jgi:hypothetical protein
MKMKKAVTTLHYIAVGFALLCWLAVPVWILGVPGAENEYARGWKMGLSVILAYPAIILPVFIAWRKAGKSAEEAHRDSRRRYLGMFSIALLLLALLCLTAAFQIMWYA